MIFENGLQGPAKELFDRLFTVGFDAESLRRELDTGKYSADDVNDAAINYVDECISPEPDDDRWQLSVKKGEARPKAESDHLKDAMEVLLDYGLDPNKIYRIPDESGHAEEYNIMQCLRYIYNGYQAADSLYVLLSHGGDPNLNVQGRLLVEDPDFEVWLDTIDREEMDIAVYNAKLHYFMVLAGFGARHKDGRLPIEPVEGFDVSKLREHRNYYYGIIESDKTKDGWQLCFFDKHTNWERARF